MHYLMAGLALALTLATPARAENNADVVRGFIDAFNRVDVDGMLAFTTEDIRWMSVRDAGAALQSEGREELRAAMSDYFANVPSARAEIRSLEASGPFVHTVEEAFWESGETEKSQCSMAIYRLEDGLIATAWYFPAYDCSGGSSTE